MKYHIIQLSSVIQGVLIICIIIPVKMKGDWNLIEYITSVDGKPFPPHAPYLCPEQRMSFTIDAEKRRMNISQASVL